MAAVVGSRVSRESFLTVMRERQEAGAGRPSDGGEAEGVAASPGRASGEVPPGKRWSVTGLLLSPVKD